MSLPIDARTSQAHESEEDNAQRHETPLGRCEAVREN